MKSEPRRSFLDSLWRQLPFFLWLVLLWMLLWGQFTLVALLSGIGVAIFVTRVFRVPPVELSGRINLWYLLVYAVTFLWAVIVGSLHVSWQVVNPRSYPGTAVMAVPLNTSDDLILTHVGVTASLIPGSLVVQTDREDRVIYLHVLGVKNREDLEKQRAGVLTWEDRIIRAVGSTAQYAALKEREAAA